MDAKSGAPRGGNGSGASPGVLLTVLVVDDSALVREVLRRKLGDLPGVEVVAEAATVEQAAAIVRAQRPDVVTVDLQLGAESGLELLDLLAQLDRPPVPVVVATFASEMNRRLCAERGVAFFLDKAHDLDQLPDILRHLTIPGSSSA